MNNITINLNALIKLLKCNFKLPPIMGDIYGYNNIIKIIIIMW